MIFQKSAKASLPDWYSDDLFETLKKCSMLFIDIMSLTSEMKKLNIGPLIKRFLENMNAKDETTNPRKMYLYSGHDVNVGAWMRTHSIKNFRYHDFGCAVILEKLRSSQNEVYVRVRRI